MLLVARAVGVHPVPSRTRKLSPPASMVVEGQPSARVDRRQLHPSLLFYCGTNHKATSEKVDRDLVDGNKKSRDWSSSPYSFYFFFWESCYCALPVEKRQVDVLPVLIGRCSCAAMTCNWTIKCRSSVGLYFL
jgi:hypothetical protein